MEPIEFPRRNPHERIRISHQVFKGTEMIDIRIFFLNKDNGWSPTQRGLRITLQDAKGLKEALEGALT